MNIYQGSQIDEFLARIDSRRVNISEDVEKRVGEILAQVRERGDDALVEYAKMFDGVDLTVLPIETPIEELQQAHDELPRDLLEIIRESRDNIRRFHEKALPQSWVTLEDDGVILGQRLLPIERVGVYVPGGRAAYPSSLLMGVVPAQVAGVSDIIVATPCDSKGAMNRTILAAAYELGIKRVFRLGGAQAIAALAYGTSSVPRVDKIVGPGNIYVATAKKMLFGQCGIDMVAGPSEVLIIADTSADAEFIAADLLAQAEHDPLASSILVTDSLELAQAVVTEVTRQTALLPRSAIIDQSLKNYGGIALCSSLDRCVDISNKLAPEHLGLHVEQPWDILSRIRNAGAVFLGNFSPEAVGDYWAGPNHVLPTSGSARFFSPLRTEDFLKASSIIAYSREALQKHGKKIERFAVSEGLDAHAAAISRRTSK
jgi:histidinol dehydrogenase